MRAKQRHSFFALLTLLLTTTIAMGQTAAIRLDTTEIQLGGQTRLNLTFGLPVSPTEAIIWPAFTDTLTGQIEVISSSTIDTLTSESRFELLQTLTITSFDTGYVVIPPIQFGLGEQRFESNALLLHVVAPVVELMPRDVKEIYEVEYTLVDWLIDHLEWIVGGCILMLLSFWLIRRWRMRPRSVAVETEPVIERLPAAEEALNALNELERKELWQKGAVKEYQSELTDALRIYIERRYHVRTMERTTRQILADLRMMGVPGDAYNRLKATLQLADVVKFAKFIPEPEEHIAALENARFFVEQTRQTPPSHE